MAQAYVQKTTLQTSGTNYVNSISGSMPATPTAGSLLVMGVSQSSTSSATFVISVSATGQTWTRAGGVASQYGGVEIWYAQNVPATNPTITISLADFYNVGFEIYELSGMAISSALDKTTTQYDGINNFPKSRTVGPTATLSQANEIVVMGSTFSDIDAAPTTSSSAFTQEVSGNTGSFGSMYTGIYIANSTLGVQTTLSTTKFVNSSSIMATFKEASSGPAFIAARFRFPNQAVNRGSTY